MLEFVDLSKIRNMPACAFLAGNDFIVSEYGRSVFFSLDEIYEHTRRSEMMECLPENFFKPLMAQDLAEKILNSSNANLYLEDEIWWLNWRSKNEFIGKVDSDKAIQCAAIHIHLTYRLIDPNLVRVLIQNYISSSTRG